MLPAYTKYCLLCHKSKHDPKGSKSSAHILFGKGSCHYLIGVIARFSPETLDGVSPPTYTKIFLEPICKDTTAPSCTGEKGTSTEEVVRAVVSSTIIPLTPEANLSIDSLIEGVVSLLSKPPTQ